MKKILVTFLFSCISLSNAFADPCHEDVMREKLVDFAKVDTQTDTMVDTGIERLPEVNPIEDHKTQPEKDPFVSPVPMHHRIAIAKTTFASYFSLGSLSSCIVTQGEFTESFLRAGVFALLSGLLRIAEPEYQTLASGHVIKWLFPVKKLSKNYLTLFQIVTGVSFMMAIEAIYVQVAEGGLQILLGESSPVGLDHHFFAIVGLIPLSLVIAGGSKKLQEQVKTEFEKVRIQEHGDYQMVTFAILYTLVNMIYSHNPTLAQLAFSGMAVYGLVKYVQFLKADTGTLEQVSAKILDNRTNTHRVVRISRDILQSFKNMVSSCYRGFLNLSNRARKPS